MSQVAGGLHGQQAVDAIVRRFERPADPSGEITRAMSVYGRMPAGQAGRRMTAPGVGRGNPQAARQAAARFQNALQIAMSGGDVQQAWNQLARAAGQMQAIRWGGTIEQPPAWQRSGPPGSSSATVNRALQVAHAQLGKPYVWGGESPGEGGFDCSGLIDFALRQAGVDVPGRLTTQSALTLGKPVNLKNLRPGDMIITNGGKHMVWYVGGGRVIAAPRSGEVVQYQPLKDHIAGIVGIRRLPI
jgi:cell wall-associated NlpC family hydrolase